MQLDHRRISRPPDLAAYYDVRAPGQRFNDVDHQCRAFVFADGLWLCRYFKNGGLPLRWARRCQLLKAIAIYSRLKDPLPLQRVPRVPIFGLKFFAGR